MIVKEPPLYPQPRVIPSFTHDADHNLRELDACMLKAAEIDGVIMMPPGKWPIAAKTVSGDRDGR